MCFFTRNYKYSNRNEEIEGAYLNYSYFQSQKHVCPFLCGSEDHYSVSKTIYDSGRDLKIDQGKIITVKWIQNIEIKILWDSFY